MRFIKYEDKKKRKSEVPLTVTWKNSRMIRAHSIRGTVKEILDLSQALDLVKINLIGPPSTGKTTLAETIAHLAHKMSDIPYTVRIFSREDLLDFENTLSRLQPTNHILIFDDISFLSANAGSRKMKQIEKAFTEIRHLPGGQDVKIISIFNFHYNMAVSKYLRQSDYFFWTAVGSSELDNTIDLVGKQNRRKIISFRELYQKATTGDHIFSFKLGKKGKFEYKWRQPFAPILFWNNSKLRTVVFPQRQWIDPYCTTCTNARQSTEREKMDLDKFDESIRSKYGIGVIRQALRIKLFMMGVSTYSARVKNAMRYIDEWLDNKNFDAEQLADFYKLKDKKTVIDKLPKVT